MARPCFDISFLPQRAHASNLVCPNTSFQESTSLIYSPYSIPIILELNFLLASFLDLEQSSEMSGSAIASTCRTSSLCDIRHVANVRGEAMEMNEESIS
jgi:hypothetical protein